MTTFGHQLPNVFYYRALQQAALSGLENIYAEFRQPVMRAVSLEGGTSADAAVFFQTALQETAHLYRDADFSNPETENNLPPFFQQIKALALAHYRDWRSERREAAFQHEPDGNADSRPSAAPERSVHTGSFPNYIEQESLDKYDFVWGQIGEHKLPADERASSHSAHSDGEDGSAQDATDAASALENNMEEQEDTSDAALSFQENANEQDDTSSPLQDKQKEQDNTPDTAQLPEDDEEENHAATVHAADRSFEEEKVKEREEG